MYVLRRTVGTAITIKASDFLIHVKLTGIDMLGACALLHVRRGDGPQEGEPLELGPGEQVQLHPDVRVQLLRLAYATHGGTPARVAEFGFDAPRSILIRPTEKM
jgi:hypothetical protein